MPTQAIASYGTLIKLGDGGGPEVFTTIAEVQDIAGPGIIARTEEATAHDGTGWVEHVSTLLEAGEVTFDIHLVPNNATHNHTTGLLYLLRNRIRRNYQVVFPSNPTVTWSFLALVTSFEIGAPVEGKLTASITLLIVGIPTFA